MYLKLVLFIALHSLKSDGYCISSTSVESFLSTSSNNYLFKWKDGNNNPFIVHVSDSCYNGIYPSN